MNPNVKHLTYNEGKKDKSFSELIYQNMIVLFQLSNSLALGGKF